MFYYDRIYISEVTDSNEASASKECDIYHYWYFFDKGFQFQTDICNWCHDVLMMSMNFSNIAILNINSADHRCIINRISKSKTVKLLRNTLAEKIYKQNFLLRSKEG